MGFLSKKGKNNITRYQRRFFILISAKSLNNLIQDDTILTEDELPPWFELETIYYFQFKNKEDDSPFIGKIALRNCLNITIENNQYKNLFENLKNDFLDFSSNVSIVKDIFSWETGLNLSKPEHGFGFTLTTSERTYYFYADLITEMNKWILAVEQSVKNYKELHPEVNCEDIKIHDVDHRKTLNTKALKKIDVNEEKDAPERNIPVISRKSQKAKSNVFAKEGYLQKKNITNNLRNIIGWQQRYVCLNGGLFFWAGSNSKKETPKNLFSVDKIEKCLLHKENQFILVK